MKKLYIILFAAVFCSQITNAQGELNEITDLEYAQIKINNIAIGAIIATQGDYSKLKVMFGNDLQYRAYDFPNIGREFWNSYVYLRFEDEDYSLYNFKVYSPSTLTIRGKTIKIGDDVSALGVVTADTSQGEYTVDFIDKKTHTAFLSIKINPTSKKITDITYILF